MTVQTEEAGIRERILQLRQLCGKQEDGLKGELWVCEDGMGALYQARSAGFCFGVQRAVDTVYEQIDAGAFPIYTYGPIIHNEIVIITTLLASNHFP
jgi:hypothetical protein